MTSYIKGSVREIFFKTNNGFMVGNFKVRHTEDEALLEYINKSITFTGSFPELKEENDYLFYGNLISHPKYGYQFKVETYEQIMPETKNGVIAFLSSDLFPKIGLKTATKIVELLGETAIEKILDNYENLLLVPSLTIKRAKGIYDILAKEATSYKVIVYLQNLGFTMNEASKIYNQYKNETKNIIEDNIYQIIDDIEGIGFITTDKIALQLNVVEDSEPRIEACILFVMMDLCLKNGNTYNKLDDIYLGVSSYLNIDLDMERFNYYLLKLNQKNKIIIENDHYYLQKYYEMEKTNASVIGALCHRENHFKINFEEYIKKLEKEHNIKYNHEQKQAIIDSAQKNFLIITGGPGTGKTTIIKAVIQLYIDMNKLEDINDIIAVLAPTGRAAKRIMEATGFPAMTIHKFLKWNKETNDFGVNQNNKSPVKFVVIDEVSMIDNILLNHLFNGLQTDIKIILVGDHHQLPSVGPGQVLKDLRETNIVPVIELNHLYRQKEKSYIINLAYEIKSGELSPKYNQKHDDYNFIECSKNDIKQVVMELCKNALSKSFSYKDIQVLIPMYKGINGIDEMNRMLQDIFNPKDISKIEIQHLGITYRVGDKVLQTKNNNDLNVSNGDIGIIDSITKVDGQDVIYIDYDGEFIEYTLKDFDDVRLGYAMSIHKAQGSEFDIVILPMDLSFSRMLYRKLIYTAVTRAKKSLMIIGSKEAFIRSVANANEEKRQTSLKEFIIKLF